MYSILLTVHRLDIVSFVVVIVIIVMAIVINSNSGGKIS
jgi:hypothetical protein